VLLGPASGSERLLQRVLRLSPGASGWVGHPGAEDVLYVARGSGNLVSDTMDRRIDLRAGSSARVGRRVAAYIHNGGRGEEMTVVSVLSPPPFQGFFALEGRPEPLEAAHEDDRPSLPAGEDREFKVLTDSEHVTQFVGFIRRSKAPLHTHTYEEAVYILEGQGVVHIGEGRHEPIRPGTSIFLPRGTPHCLENGGEATLKLLGVFSPPGSPGNKREG
jgi:mannose-6-phosphate isomerase-like protein (cupin superfamily)